MPIRRIAGVAVAVFVVVAIAIASKQTLAPESTPAPSPPRALAAGEIWLPVVDTKGGTVLCAGGGSVVEIHLHGSRADARLTWMTFPDGSSRPVVWPFGTSARFEPDLVVIGPDGSEVAREGSLVSGSCGMPNGTLAEFEKGYVAPGAAAS